MKLLLIPFACMFMFFTCNKKDVTPTAPRHAIGDTAFGGIIFYFSDSAHEHGMACALSDQSSGLVWQENTIVNGYYIPRKTGATDSAIGKGAANTGKIISTFGNGTYAASACKNYSGGGFNDWFLPSKEELNELFKKRSVVRGFAAADYWSSTEGYFNTTPYPWCQNLSNGTQNYFYGWGNANSFHVRAVRSF